ncbi:MAG TPA: hypothetical protein VLQ29_15745 [Candidatus Dormibacteraeota bacterium]|nr:hypothetical protein [Candidatus Dormibacteraeota bacterium]
MFRLKTTALIAGSILGIFVVHVAARGRSFPIEVTGTIKMFDRANHIFTFQSDKRARVLTITVGLDCKFFQNGAPTGEWILKKGARVKVSYFSTIFTGNIAVKIESNPVRQNITNRDGPCQGSSGENELEPSAESPQSMLSTHAKIRTL